MRQRGISCFRFEILTLPAFTVHPVRPLHVIDSANSNNNFNLIKTHFSAVIYVIYVVLAVTILSKTYT